MKCYKYMLRHKKTKILSINNLSLKYTEQDSKTPNRLYIPNMGILEYNTTTKKDFSFHENPTAIKIAEEVLEGAHKGIFTKPKLIELSQNKIDKVIESAKARDEADNNFQEKANSLISLIN